MSYQPEPLLVCQKAAARMLGVTSVTLWRWRRAKIFPSAAREINGRPYWHRNQIEKFAAGRLAA